ncbi:MAG: hypothetical protein J6Y78_13640 [Paludibacteraceae bacterium]|nr:hypothetical protein [Paludibacteraceae bacterium]
MMMYCEKCDGVMQWRCTNTRTGVAKYKCTCCGNIVEKVDDYKPPIVEKFEPKYHFVRNGRFIVRKKIDGKFKYIGSYLDEETADKVVEKMKEYDWDTSMLRQVYTELGMHREKRLWVAA